MRIYTIIGFHAYVYADTYNLGPGLGGKYGWGPGWRGLYERYDRSGSLHAKDLELKSEPEKENSDINNAPQIQGEIPRDQNEQDQKHGDFKIREGCC